VTDANGTVRNSYTYNPYGKAIDSETQETVANDYRFAGYFWDNEPKQYYCNVRYYDPELARFSSRDVVGGKYEEPMTRHRYLYCLNDPINMIDPEGLWTESIHQSFGNLGSGDDGGN